MKIIFSKHIKLKSAIVSMVIEEEQKREDIQLFLKGKETFSNEILEERVKKYLVEIGVYRSNMQLTSRGEQVKNTGVLGIREQGKYKIWYAENDPFFKNQIFYYNRISPSQQHNKRTISKLNIAFDKTNFVLPISDSDYTSFKVIDSLDMIGEKQTQFEDIVFTWEWDGLDISLFKFTGKIEGNKIRSKSYCPERDLRKYIKNVFQDKWNVMNETYLVVINELDDKAKESFKYSFKTKYLDFEVEVKDIDIAPILKEDARSWRDWLVLKELEKDYCSINDLKSVYEAINNKAVFEEGNYSLNLPSYSDCVQALVNKDKRIATQSKAFWHISAPKDLYIINNQVETHEN